MTSGWESLQAAVAQARQEISAHVPDAETGAEGEAYVMRVTAAALADACLGHLFFENGLARALPTKGGPNPHYVMASARIDPSRRYCLEGRLHDSERVGIGLYALGENAAPLEVGYVAFDRGNADGDGRFSLELAAGASGKGAMTIPPECRILLVRTLHRGPGQRASLALTGGEAQPGLALATGTSDGALARAGQSVLAGVREYLKWTRVVAAAPNRFDVPPAELAATVQGDRDTRYYLGYYDLAPGEWLEVTMPQALPAYWSVHVYNHWFESVNPEGAHDRNTQADSDGRLRLHIGPDLPEEMANRLETSGRRRGALICRIIGEDATGIPATRLLRRS